MSNSNLVARMHDLLAQFEDGSLQPGELESQFRTCMEGMERLRLSDLHKSLELLQMLFLANMPEADAGDPKNRMANLREFVDSLLNY
jgi:hypothetical protein